MKRMTNKSKDYECRIDECMAEEWMLKLYEDYSDYEKFFCDDCPFEKYINRLAELEDKIEQEEDDLK